MIFYFIKRAQSIAFQMVYWNTLRKPGYVIAMFIDRRSPTAFGLYLRSDKPGNLLYRVASGYAETKRSLLLK